MAFVIIFPHINPAQPVHKLPLNDLNGGTTNLNYINIKDIKITGGTWNASNVINGGNNTGINITASASMTYYWIGNGGNWTDPAHWSLSSGGAAGACIPTLNDDVVFDILVLAPTHKR